MANTATALSFRVRVDKPMKSDRQTSAPLSRLHDASRKPGGATEHQRPREQMTSIKGQAKVPSLGERTLSKAHSPGVAEPDPRLVEIVRMLARKAAREWIEELEAQR